VTPKELLAAIKPAANAAAKHSPLPVLTDLCFSEGRVTGGDNIIELSLPVELDISGCVPAQRLTSALAVMPPDAELRTDIKDGRLSLRAGGSRHMLPIRPVSNYPFQAFEPAGVAVDVAAHALRRVAPAVSKDHSRPFMTGVHVFARDNALRVEASNAVLMLRSDTQGVDADIDLILPSHTVAALDDGQWQIRPGTHTVELKSGNVRIVSRVIDATYPDTDRIFNGREKRPIATIPREPLIRAIRGAAVATAGQKQPTLLIQFRPGQIEFSSADEAAESRDVLECDCTVTLNTEFRPPQLLVVLDALSGDDVLWSQPEPVCFARIESAQHSDFVALVGALRN